ncbi:hypothetical protein [Leuconostoc falkenbergense]|uniref:hypothetical protein n=1 Tax=Leuconostoc falkenbergense TaxID=2766470 RepID=UPI003F9C074B
MIDEFSLLDKVNTGDIKPTGAKPKLPLKLDGLDSENLNVYRIPLDMLYYNDANGRIRSARAHFENAARSVDDGDEYNAIVERLIEDSDSAKLKKTKKDIQEKGQLIFGYVLDDGRVIDGNRRFTALRQLQRETDQQQYFEAVILPVTFNDKANRELIKRLELALQMGIENKVDYDAVDAAVDVWQTVKIDQIMLLGDYAKNAGKTVKAVESSLNVVYLMQDFLNHINADEHNFQLIKDLKIYRLLEEIGEKLKKRYPKSGPDMEYSKQLAFTQLHSMILTGGDRVRYMRDYFEGVVDAETYNDFKEEVDEYVEELQDTFDDKQVTSAADYRTTLEELTPQFRKIQKIKNDTVNSTKRSKDAEKFIESLRQINKALADLNAGHGLTGKLRWNQFDRTEILTIRGYMSQIVKDAETLVDIYNDEL